MQIAYLEALTEIGRSLAQVRGLKNSLGRALASLGLNEEVIRSCVLLVTPDSSLAVYAAEGFSVVEYRRLESLIARAPIVDIVDKAGSPVFVERTSAVAWLEPIRREADTSLWLVPIEGPGGLLGVLWVEIGNLQSDNREHFQAFLTALATIISQTCITESEISHEKEKLFEEASHLQRELREKHDFSNIIGNSGPMRQVYSQVTQVARSNATVLLRGESGTGKEMISTAIHYNSLRTKKPFIKVNCAALPETLIESELFGYERGAFTGANQRKKGRFELADGGTLFLDEIGDLTLQTQVKLLRVLQEREFERLGGTETIRVNIRLVAATNKDLEKEMEAGRFREDLFYRLNVFTIFLPPLRDRKSDILLLSEHFLEKYEKIHNKRIKRISTPAIDMLTAYHYPGNVRELENAIERAVVSCDEAVIHAHHLPPTLQTADVTGTVTNLSLESAVAAFERDMIQDALKTTQGNCAKAASLLGTTERIINYKIKKYAINPRRFKN